MGLRTLLTNFETGKQAYPFHNTPEDVGGFNYSGVNKNSRSIFDEGVTFNQKSLQFGSGTAFDRPGGGFSSEPYIRVDLTDIERSGLSRGIDTITGGLIRGGAATAVRRAAQDTERIGSWLLTGKGLLWVAREIGLQASNPQISQPVVQRSVANQRTFSPLNLIAQIPASITGVHVKREGNTPLSFEGYADAPELFGDDSSSNRLLFLHESHILSNIGTPESQAEEGGSKIGNFFRGVKDKIKQSLSKDRSGVELFTTPGGSESYYGIGNTTINKYAPFTTDALLYDQRERALPLNSFLVGEQINSTLIHTGGDIDSSFGRFLQKIDLFTNESIQFTVSTKGKAQKPVNVNEFVGRYRSLIEESREFRNVGKIQDFRFSLMGGKHMGADYRERVKDADYRTFHRESRIGLGTPGVAPPTYLNPGDFSSYIRQSQEGKLDYSVKNFGKIDILNAMDIVKTSEFENVLIKDLIPFRIEAVDNDNPSMSNVMVFRALLDTYNDTFNANHNEFRYNGRAEPFFTYEGFSRDISFSFKIAAQTRHEMKPLYRKLNYLVSQTAPEYRQGRMRAPYVKVTLGDLLDRVPGLIKTITLSWDKNYPWEITLDDSSALTEFDKNMLMLPHVLNVNVQFITIHNFTPQRSIHAPFILPHEINGTLEEGKKWYKKGAASSYEEADNSLLSKPFVPEEVPLDIDPDDLDLIDIEPEEEEEEVLDIPTTGQEEINDKAAKKEERKKRREENKARRQQEREDRQYVRQQRREERRAERKKRRSKEPEAPQTPEITQTVDNEGAGHLVLSPAPLPENNPVNPNNAPPAAPRDTRSQRQRINDSVLGGV